jgi:hypothetical protein
MQISANRDECAGWRIRIVDRIKHVIKAGREWVSSPQIEELIGQN